VVGKGRTDKQGVGRNGQPVAQKFGDLVSLFVTSTKQCDSESSRAGVIVPAVSNMYRALELVLMACRVSLVWHDRTNKLKVERVGKHALGRIGPWALTTDCFYWCSCSLWVQTSALCIHFLSFGPWLGNISRCFFPTLIDEITKGRGLIITRVRLVSSIDNLNLFISTKNTKNACNCSDQNKTYKGGPETDTATDTDVRAASYKSFWSVDFNRRCPEPKSVCGD